MTRPSWQDFGTHDESAFPELWDGVIGAWAPCLGPTGSRLHDMSRRANWGTLTNMDPPTDWVVNGGQYALDFDGSDDRIECSNVWANQTVSFFTCSYWVRVRSGYGIAIAANWTTGFIEYVDPTTQRQRLYLGQAGFIDSAIPVSGNVWRQYWFLFDNGTTKIGYDGQLVTNASFGNAANFTINNGSHGNKDTITFGGYASSETLNGQMDDVMIWNRALSPNEIRQVYQLGRGGMYQRRRRRAIYLPQAGFQAAWARQSNVLLGFNQP